MKKSRITVTTLALMATSASAFAASMMTYKSPQCGCCTDWVTHMEQAGFTSQVENHSDMNSIKKKFGVTGQLASCHTAVIDGYVFEGHIPASDIKAFLANPPSGAIGLAVPGMPLGSPGMEYGDKKQPYHVYAFNEEGQVFTYNSHQQEEIKK